MAFIYRVSQEEVHTFDFLLPVHLRTDSFETFHTLITVTENAVKMSTL